MKLIKIRILTLLIISFFIQSCSFDSKSGIWTNETLLSKKEKDAFKDFKTLSSTKNYFNEIVKIEKNYKFKLSKPILNYDWTDKFYDKSNNFNHFRYQDLNKLIYKSKKITNSKTNNNLMFKNDKIIFSDKKGNLIFFSLKEKKIIKKFNFYKNKFKKIDKNLNLILENNIVFVSDNLGYLYSFDYKKRKIVWAKNYKIPFSSNLKIYKDNLIASNQNNNLFFFDKRTGDVLKSIPTEEIIVKKKFINNLSLQSNNILFLNTFGSLYSINNDNFKINWFLNLNQSTDFNISNLFFANEIIHYRNKIVISSNRSLFVINANNGSVIFKKDIIASIKPIMADDYIFLITKNNLLLAFDLNKGKIIYSYNIDKEISNFLNIKKRNASLKTMFLLDNKIFVFLNNSFYVKFSIYGVLEEVKKLPSKINTNPIIVKKSLIFLDFKNKLSVVN